MFDSIQRGLKDAIKRLRGRGRLLYSTELPLPRDPSEDRCEEPSHESRAEVVHQHRDLDPETRNHERTPPVEAAYGSTCAMLGRDLDERRRLHAREISDLLFEFRRTTSSAMFVL